MQAAVVLDRLAPVPCRYRASALRLSSKVPSEGETAEAIRESTSDGGVVRWAPQRQ